MYEYPSKQGSARRRILADETGSAVSEWVVAAAIVGLFSIPVIALINSGTQQRSEPVVAVMEDPDSEEAKQAYAIGGAGDGEGDAGGEGTASGRTSGTATSRRNSDPSVPPGYSGLNKGVGYDIDVSDVRGSGQGRSNGLTTTRRNDLSRLSTTPGPSGPKPSNRNPSSNDGPNDGRTRVLAVPRRSADEELRRRRIAGIQSAPRVVRPSNPAALPDQNVAQTDPRCDNIQPKSVFNQPPDIQTQDDLNAALVENVDDSKIDALLDNVRIRILDEEEPAAEPDCPEQELAAVAPEQLEDGTILGPVTISTNTDQLPSQRQRPEGIADAPSLDETTLGQTYNARVRAERLPIPADRDALAKLLGEDVPPLSPSARLAPPSLVPDVSLKDIRPSETGVHSKPARGVRAVASASLGQDILSLPAQDVFNEALAAVSSSEVRVGAKSSVSVGVSVDLPDIKKRDVPILRSGR